MMESVLQTIYDAKKDWQLEVIDLCEHNLFEFAKTINPFYCYGDIHEEVFSWLGDPEANERQLLLLPRGHLKSHCIAVYCAWRITFEPWITIVYLASQDDLAKAQLHSIKQMMTSDRYTMYWPEMFTEQRVSRRKTERGVWSAYAFDVDHPARRERGVRDHTMLIKTVKSNAQGLHCDGLVLDDVVVPQFADTPIGRKELATSLGYFSSILNPGGWVKGVGTRYHPEDAYQSMIDSVTPIWNPDIEDYEGEERTWDVMEHVVEDSPNRSGTGRYLWPRTESPHDGKRYGFDPRELARIKADYIAHGSLVNFYSQYYNDPNDVGTERIGRDKFQYYEERHITVRDNKVFYKDKRLNVYAGMDVAWSEGSRADYTALAVVGVDSDGFFYILALDRFRTSDFLVYYERVQALQHQFPFRRLLVETNAAGSLVAQEIEKFIRRDGMPLVVDRRAANRKADGKAEHWATVLEPKYNSKSVFHTRGGFTPILEEELVSAKPRYDDLKDAVCAAMSIAVPPAGRRQQDPGEVARRRDNVVVGRFGGRARMRG